MSVAGGYHGRLAAWQWWHVHRVDTDSRYRSTTMSYLASMAVMHRRHPRERCNGGHGANGPLGGGGGRLGHRWAPALVSRDHTDGSGEGVPASLVERLGLFTMGIWWNYFAMLGRRVPRQRGPRLTSWPSSHLPLTMAITAAVAAMVGLVGHADPIHVRDTLPSGE